MVSHLTFRSLPDAKIPAVMMGQRGSVDCFPAKAIGGFGGSGDFPDISSPISFQGQRP